MKTHRGIFFLYGPPGSGKSTLGGMLARELDLPFYDLDGEIEIESGQTISKIFSAQGEASFRALERSKLAQILAMEKPGVIALGGGTLLDDHNRGLVEACGLVLCLTARPEALVERLRTSAARRPLLTGVGDQPVVEKRLISLLEKRSGHYVSFRLRLETSDLPPQQALEASMNALGAWRVAGMGDPYPVRVLAGGLNQTGEFLLNLGLEGPLALVCDHNLARLHAARSREALETAGYHVHQVVIPVGEDHKTLATVAELWNAFLKAGVERASTVVSLGGGVVGDLAGFAAATYLRGVRWVNLPTTLLAMVDASLGGKTGFDLPQGKNLVGAFHPPALVLADPQSLETLPREELLSGLAEVVKHSLIGDPALFETCARGLEVVLANLDEIVRRSMAVKIQVIRADPYEGGLRMALNLGHTLGHALETASGYRLRHGEAVAIGMVFEARLAERLGLAEPGLSNQIKAVLSKLDLPTEVPEEIESALILKLIQVDKKRRAGQVRFSLPVRVGEVRTGLGVNLDENLMEVLR